MPMHVYTCSKCEYSKEYLESMSQNVTHYCGKCNLKMDKTIGVSNFYLKGKNWPGRDIKRGS